MKLQFSFSAKVLPGANSREDPGGAREMGKESPNWKSGKSSFHQSIRTIRVPKNRKKSSRVWPLSRIVLEMEKKHIHTHIYIYIYVSYHVYIHICHILHIIYLYNSIHVFDMKYDQNVDTGTVDFYLNSSKNHH